MSKSRQVATALLKAIDDGRLSPGTRVASIREAAQQFGVSKNTVIDAYDQLVAQGHLSARQGAGFFVTRPRPSPMDESTHDLSEAVDSVSLLREQLVGNFAVRVGDGRAPASWMGGTELTRLIRRRTGLSDEMSDVEYGMPQGYSPLRESLAMSLAGRSIHASHDQIMMTFGANHAFDLIIRHFIAPGENVLVETPGYYPLFGKLRLAKAKLVGVPRTASGPDLEEFERKARQYRPRLFFLQPNAHNPTGSSMSLKSMHQLLKLADHYGVTLVEDDVFADILPKGTPHLAALDGLERVIYVGTFSKTLSTGLRCGYVAGSRSVIRALVDIKMLTVVNTSTFNEMVIHDLLARGRYRRHLAQLRERVAKASATAIRVLSQIGVSDVTGPGGGYYLWARLPPHINTTELAKRASEQGIFIAPGAIFSLRPDSTDANSMRINIAHANDHRFLDFVSKTLKA
ncbi:aminotransferase-like domain-containing protein [Vreelandella hamiltonii]|uniref:aminotransferase-like domain-containing protein n=1 Tax=Vreelandella hamiltonii TaxID=502829 RepID=UPI00054A9129|nr:PLP-dependent aminotransferase family protein [Halomonas johnsoniae]ATH77436.1 PLP-dependent aminotransferase family protein [Halomonas hydrothermalis]KHJ52672.1 GntR family transcriptional regulator [Halomonas hydrothermalis]